MNEERDEFVPLFLFIIELCYNQIDRADLVEDCGMPTSREYFEQLSDQLKKDAANLRNQLIHLNGQLLQNERTQESLNTFLDQIAKDTQLPPKKVEGVSDDFSMEA